MPTIVSARRAVAVVLAVVLLAVAVASAAPHSASLRKLRRPSPAAAPAASLGSSFLAAAAKVGAYAAINAWKALAPGNAGRTLAALRTAAHTDGTVNGQALVAAVGSQPGVVYALAAAGQRCPGAVVTATHTVANAAPAGAADSSAVLTAMVRAIGMPVDQAGHIFPQRLGGGRDPKNFVPMGTSCNQKNSAWNDAETHSAALFAHIRNHARRADCTTRWRVTFQYLNRHWPCRPTHGTYHVDSTTTGAAAGPGALTTDAACRAALSHHQTAVNRGRLDFVDKERWCRPGAAQPYGWHTRAACVPAVAAAQVPRFVPHAFPRAFGVAATPFGNSPHSDSWADLLRWYNGLYQADVVDPANGALPANVRLAQLSNGAGWAAANNVAVPVALRDQYHDAKQLLLDGLTNAQANPAGVAGAERTPGAVTFPGVGAEQRFDRLNRHAERGTNPVRFEFDATNRLVKAVFKASEVGANNGGDPSEQVRAMMTFFGTTNDQAGHVIKKSFGGSGADPRNFVPMSPACNMAGSAWHTAEDHVAKLNRGMWVGCTSVTSTIEFAYADPNHPYRPTHGWYTVAATGRSAHKKNPVKCDTQNLNRRLWINTPQYETVDDTLAWFERVLGTTPFTTNDQNVANGVAGAIQRVV